jgi:hypothetical protein
MSQTSGQPGHDPEKEEWLKQFTGLPSSETPAELHIERPEYQPLAVPRSNNVNIYDQRPTTNDHVFPDASGELPTATSATRNLRWFFFGLLAVVAVVLVASSLTL